MLDERQETADLIKEFLEGCRDIILTDLEANKRNATGQTAASLQIETTPLSGKLLGADHIIYTFKGRGPGEMPPLSRIVEWCRARGIPGTRAWSIAKTIRDQGTRLWRMGGTDTLERASSQERIDEFIKKIREDYIAQAKSEFDNLVMA